jgi:phosphatidylglycerol:prolipoprotein diacylglycerol transferase
VTGDWFAIIAPVGIMLGRIGCWLHGCCLGRVCGPHWFTVRDSLGTERWPAVPAEMLFNAAMLSVFLVLRRQRRLTGQHFHLYLISYGAFRFIHEFWRETPRLAGLITGYQVISIGMIVFGAWAFRRRAEEALRSCA